MIGGKSVFAVIPARGGSKGLPGKNILPVQGRPLIWWTIEAARASRYIDRFVVSSDDPEIIKTAQQLGCEAPFQRSSDLATDEASSVDVAIDILRRLPGFDLLVLLQPTSPLRTAVDIDNALQLLLDSKAPACISLRTSKDDPCWAFEMSDDHKLHRLLPGTLTATRRQDRPPTLYPNGAIYATLADSLLRSRSFFPIGTVGYLMPRNRALDIDTSEDFAVFEEIIRTTGAARPEVS